MLAVNVGEHFAELLELLHGAALTINIASRAAFYRIKAAQYALIVGTVIVALKPFDGFFKAFNIKGRGNFCTVFTVANSPRIGPVTQSHAQCIQYQ